MKKIILVSLLLTLASSTEALTIKEVCNLQDSELVIDGPEELDYGALICRLNGLPEVELYRPLLSITSILGRQLTQAQAAFSLAQTNGLPGETEAAQLQEVRRELADQIQTIQNTINEARNGRPYTPNPSSALGSSLSELMNQFATTEQRESNPEGYFLALRRTVGHFSMGPDLLRCFDRINNPEVAGSRIQFMSTEEVAAQANTQGYFGLFAG